MLLKQKQMLKHIGRLAAIQTKQLFRQKIRETEKETLI